jgi:ATP-dependent DNA helicase RecG
MSGFFERSIEFLKGVGPQKAELMKKELNIFTFSDLIEYFPFRYEDRTKFYKINQIDEELPFVQIIGKLKSMQMVGAGHKQRLVGQFADDTGTMELVWFQGAKWIQSKLKLGVDYVAFGKPARFGATFNIAHPEMDLLSESSTKSTFLRPVYHTSEKLKKRYVDSKAIMQMMKALLTEAVNHINETLSTELIQQYKLIDKKTALIAIHFPKDARSLQQARYRLKFEELFYIQLRLIKLKIARIDSYPGIRFHKSDLLNEYYANHLPFELTGAQKRVVKEIYGDFRSGKQMNRLVQGDVGSGKTMVAFLCMLIAISNGTQCAFMAPTEILADQHYQGLQEQAAAIGIKLAKLTGSSKKSQRNVIHQGLESGEIQIIVGTHALLEDKVKFQNLGLAIIDEQHRFGVAQRAKLWNKNEGTHPHILVMTATPIPRTLAMTLYGDLDISVIDEMPAGRKPIKTYHMRDSMRLKMFGFIEKEVEKGRQVYIVYPLIEESSTLDYKDLMDGYESISRRFPNYPLSIVHGKMKAEDKDWEMARFVKGETKIMVATTVIEVGVNVPNASIMVIENAERFGLSQLHQLRGRVGRGAEQSHCILMTGDKLTKEGKERIKTMVDTTDGFVIAEVDLQLRGPGDLMGTQQSGLMDLKISDLGTDGEILKMARSAASEILNNDPDLTLSQNLLIKRQVESQSKNTVNWSRVS